MATPTALRKLARQRLDQRLQRVRDAAAQFSPPPAGWLRAVREALGMSLQDLGDRLGMTRTSAMRLEQSEKRGTIQLDSLRRMADALDCDVVYGLVPRRGLEATYADQQLVSARNLNRTIARHMELEAQHELDPSLKDQRTEAARDLIADRDLWKIPK